MLLAIREKLLRLRLDSKTFFRMAHIHCFGRDPDLTEDVRLFETKGVVPRYVERYMSFLQGELQ